MTARLSQRHPNLDIWITSGSLPDDSARIFAQMNARMNRVNLDYSATDTLSNFTTILPELQNENIRHIYLVTSDYHMPRARAIAAIVLGSHGIVVTPVTVPSAKNNETLGACDSRCDSLILLVGHWGNRLPSQASKLLWDE